MQFQVNFNSISKYSDSAIEFIRENSEKVIIVISALATAILAAIVYKISRSSAKPIKGSEIKNEGKLNSVNAFKDIPEASNPVLPTLTKDRVAIPTGKRRLPTRKAKS